MKFIQILFILASVFVIACSGEKKDEKKDDETSDKKEVKYDLKKYLDTLNTREIDAIQKAVLYYQQHYKITTPLSCDSQLVALKNFSLRATNDLNERNVIAKYQDENGEITEASEKKFKKLGLLVEYAEGSPYFIVDAGYLKEHMEKCLSKPMLDFLNEFESENEDVPVVDAGIVIEFEELARRLLFWEKFITDNPGFILENEARATYSFYLALYLTGIDNTLAFGLTTGGLNPEFHDMYKYVLKKYPGTKTAELTSDYLEILAENNFVLNENVERYLDEIESPFKQEIELTN